MNGLVVYSQLNDAESLEHHGIKGQKWGVRRQTNTKKNVKSKRKTKENVKSLSDSELEARIRRLNMEKQYRSLSSSDVKKGSTYVSTALAIIGGVATVVKTANGVVTLVKSAKGLVPKG